MMEYKLSEEIVQKLEKTTKKEAGSFLKKRKLKLLRLHQATNKDL